MSPLDAVLDALARRFGTRGLCRMAHGANHLRPSLVGGGSYRCAVCGAGFGSPAEAVGLPAGSLDVTDRTWALYAGAERLVPETKAVPRPRAVAKVEQFRKRGVR